MRAIQSLQSFVENGEQGIHHVIPASLFNFFAFIPGLSIPKGSDDDDDDDDDK